jgi:hypothetical protein
MAHRVRESGFAKGRRAAQCDSKRQLLAKSVVGGKHEAVLTGTAVLPAFRVRDDVGAVRVSQAVDFMHR